MVFTKLNLNLKYVLLLLKESINVPLFSQIYLLRFLYLNSVKFMYTSVGNKINVFDAFIYLSSFNQQSRWNFLDQNRIFCIFLPKIIFFSHILLTNIS